MPSLAWIEINLISVWQDGIDQQGSMAACRIALEAEQRGGALRSQFDQLRCLNNRLGQVELTRIEFRQTRMLPLARRFATCRRGAKRLEAGIFDPRLAQSGCKDILRKSRAARQRNGPHIGQDFNARSSERLDQLCLGYSLIADGENLHERDAFAIASISASIDPGQASS